MISLLPVILTLAFVAAFFRVSFVLHALSVVGGLYVLASLWSAGARHGLVIRRAYEPRAMLGDTTTVRLEVENRGLWPIPWARVHERLPIALASPPSFVGLVALWPKGKTTLSYELQCRQRGYFGLGGLNITSGDVFGLRTQTYDLVGASYLTVYPAIVALDELGLPSKSPFGHLRAREPLYEDPSRAVGVRDYQSGDSLRKINWKTSAAVGRLQVRRLEPAMTLQTVLLLNLALDEYERQDAYYATEQAIVVAASIANHLVGLRQEVGLATNGRDPLGGSPTGLAVRKGRGHLIGILEMLGRIDQTSGADFLSLLRGQMSHLPWGATLVIITSNDRPGLWDTLLALRRAGFSVVLVFCDYPSLIGYNQARGRAESLGFICHRVWKTEDLDVWRRRSPVGQ